MKPAAPSLRVEILFRTGYDHPYTHMSEDRRDETGIWVPATHCWFEAPEDMHIHFGSDATGENMCHPPYFSEALGDYLVPDPKHLSSFVRAYSVMIFPGGAQCSRLPKASREYIAALRKVWESPNDIIQTKTRMAVARYERKGLKHYQPKATTARSRH